MKAKKQTLVQTLVPLDVSKKLNLLVKAAGRTRADYLRRLIVAHTENIDPLTVKGIEKAWRGVVKEEKL